MNRRALLVTGALLALAIALDVITGSKNVPGYSAGIGLLGGIAIILVAKGAGTLLLRPESPAPQDAHDPGTPGGRDG